MERVPGEMGRRQVEQGFSSFLPHLMIFLSGAYRRSCAKFEKWRKALFNLPLAHFSVEIPGTQKWISDTRSITNSNYSFVQKAIVLLEVHFFFQIFGLIFLEVLAKISINWPVIYDSNTFFPISFSGGKYQQVISYGLRIQMVQHHMWHRLWKYCRICMMCGRWWIFGRFEIFFVQNIMRQMRWQKWWIAHWWRQRS